LQQVIRQCARICIDLDLIEGNILFMDGTRLRANAAIDQSFSVFRGYRLRLAAAIAAPRIIIIADAGSGAT
jgi:hypothetical protein